MTQSQLSLDLFVRAAPAPLRNRTDALFEIAFSPEVKAEILAVASARSGEWLNFRDFQKIISKWDIGFCLGHVLSSMARAGQLQEKKIYNGTGIGAEQPGSGNYHGYRNEWSAA